MTDPTPPRAPVAVPEAIYHAVQDVRVRAHRTGVADSNGAISDETRVQRAHESAQAFSTCLTAIATALREATETRDQEIARLTGVFDENLMLRIEIERLTTELAAAKAEIKADEEVISDLEQTAAAVASGILHAEIESVRNELAAERSMRLEDIEDNGKLSDALEAAKADTERWQTVRDAATITCDEDGRVSLVVVLAASPGRVHAPWLTDAESRALNGDLRPIERTDAIRCGFLRGADAVDRAIDAARAAGEREG